ncbi:Aa_trans domain-containing protein [Durusdinium trenchii]|uniref:Aa_trans domain-containing protein n=1 Tax=Durusdinium trenchii TaxID=1381693 RepID=A0ABP0K9U0_9DINO
MRRDSFEIDTSRLREPQRASTERTSFVLNAHDAAGKGSSFVYISSGKGLSICEATTVIFNSGLGATIAAVPYFANLSGYLGFVFVTVAMAVTGVLEQQTLLRASADRNAKTFDELCQPIPAWARQMTVWCGLVYLWACAGWYFHFVLSFVEAQLCPVLCRSSGDNFLCQSRWHFGFPIGIMLFAVSFPAELSGSMSRAINCTSMIAKTTAILIALVKGALVWHQKTEASELIAWKPTAFAAVASNMIGTFANTGIMPQVAADLKPSLLHRAVRICPCSAVSLQTCVCLAVGLVGYASLGNLVELDAFKVYQEHYPDMMSRTIQFAGALMMYLCYPFLVLPCKSQIWSFMTSNPEIRLSEAPFAIQVLMTSFFAVTNVVTPILVGPKAFANFLIILGCTVGVWMNLFLPALIIVHAQILPSRSSGVSSRASVTLVLWLCFVGVLCLIEGMVSMTKPTKKETLLPLSEECERVFNAHHPK